MSAIGGGGGGDLYRYLYGETGKNHAIFGPTIHPRRLGQYVSIFSTNEMDEQRLLCQYKIYTAKVLFKSGTNKAQLSLPSITKKNAACICHMQEKFSKQDRHMEKNAYFGRLCI